MKVLVAFATNAGSTEEVADAITKTLGEENLEVDLSRITEVGSLEAYDAVLVGAPMIVGWHKQAQRFIRRNRRALGAKKVAYFITALNLVETKEPVPSSIPLFLDPSLVKEPKNKDRLNMKEKHATVASYIRPMSRRAPGVKPLSIGIFGGKLDYTKLKFLPMLFVMLVIGAQPGDFRNWDALKEWARSTGKLLSE
jgi:menaquinone-dependent protoporphyrinogen IX oxidase